MIKFKQLVKRFLKWLITASDVNLENYKKNNLEDDDSIPGGGIKPPQKDD